MNAAEKTANRVEQDPEPVAELSAEERQVVERIRKQGRTTHCKAGRRRLPSPSTLFFAPIF
jgi:hypothetical protein